NTTVKSLPIYWKASAKTWSSWLKLLSQESNMPVEILLGLVKYEPGGIFSSKEHVAAFKGALLNYAVVHEDVAYRLFPSNFGEIAYQQFFWLPD
ncbi:hypothetical protein KI387_043336, partial [Taxus chinensis]